MLKQQQNYFKILNIAIIIMELKLNNCKLFDIISDFNKITHPENI